MIIQKSSTLITSVCVCVSLIILFMLSHPLVHTAHISSTGIEGEGEREKERDRRVAVYPSKVKVRFILPSYTIICHLRTQRKAQ